MQLTPQPTPPKPPTPSVCARVRCFVGRTATLIRDLFLVFFCALCNPFGEKPKEDSPYRPGHFHGIKESQTQKTYRRVRNFFRLKVSRVCSLLSRSFYLVKLTKQILVYLWGNSETVADVLGFSIFVISIVWIPDVVQRQLVAYVPPRYQGLLVSFTMWWTLKFLAGTERLKQKWILLILLALLLAVCSAELWMQKGSVSVFFMDFFCNVKLLLVKIPLFPWGDVNTTTCKQKLGIYLKNNIDVQHWNNYLKIFFFICTFLSIRFWKGQRFLTIAFLASFACIESGLVSNVYHQSLLQNKATPEALPVCVNASILNASVDASVNASSVLAAELVDDVVSRKILFVSDMIWSLHTECVNTTFWEDVLENLIEGPSFLYSRDPEKPLSCRFLKGAANPDEYVRPIQFLIFGQN